jgi:hypothetical protein
MAKSLASNSLHVMIFQKDTGERTSRGTESSSMLAAKTLPLPDYYEYRAGKDEPDKQHTSRYRLETFSTLR